MGTPLREQLLNPIEGAAKNCEGCWGAGWLTALVDDPPHLEEAGLVSPHSFLMKCDECQVFENDEEAAEVARKAGMQVNEHLVVTFTSDQLDFLKAAECAVGDLTNG